MLFFSRLTILVVVIAFTNGLSLKNVTRSRFGMKDDFPDSVNWIDKGYVTPVKNQGQCNSGWAFSAVGAVEGQHFKFSGELISLSVQNVIDCSNSFGANGCQDGLLHQAYQYMEFVGGIESEDNYPYEGHDGSCRFTEKNIAAEVTGYEHIEPSDEQTLKSDVALNGPISVMIDASHESFKTYESGIYFEENCSKSDLNHGVLVVGYGTADGEDYWLVKNSYGTDWGENGYIRMARNRNNNCGIATFPIFPLVE